VEKERKPESCRDRVDTKLSWELQK